MSLELALDERVVTFEEIAPVLVAQLDGSLGRPDDVGKEHGGQCPLRVCRRAVAR